MKIESTLLLLSSLICLSCSDSGDKLLTNDIYGKWQLVRMTGSFAGSETTGDAMDWQEFYFFNSDDTFSRLRTRNGETIEEKGTFSAKVYDDGREYFSLIYPNESLLVGSCYGTDQEELVFSLKNTLSSTWQACDGPGLDYEKVTN